LKWQKHGDSYFEPVGADTVRLYDLPLSGRQKDSVLFVGMRLACRLPLRSIFRSMTAGSLMVTTGFSMESLPRGGGSVCILLSSSIISGLGSAREAEEQKARKSA